MMSKPVMIDGEYYNSARLAAEILKVDKGTIKNRVFAGIEGYSFCAYQPPKERRCSVCKEVKPLIEFKKSKGNRCGRGFWCKTCHAASVLGHLQTEHGKELSNNRFKTYRKTGTCKKARVRYKTGAAGKAAKARYAHQRRVRISGLVNDLTAADWAEILQEQGNTCKICSRSFTEELQPQRDHITPVVANGPFTKSNVQALCVNCNSTKGSKIIPGFSTL